MGFGFIVTASSMLYNRTEHSQAFFICQIWLHPSIKKTMETAIECFLLLNHLMNHVPIPAPLSAHLAAEINLENS